MHFGVEWPYRMFPKRKPLTFEEEAVVYFFHLERPQMTAREIAAATGYPTRAVEDFARWQGWRKNGRGPRFKTASMEFDEMDLWPCTKCGGWKLICDFPIDRRKPLERAYTCKECKKNGKIHSSD